MMEPDCRVVIGDTPFPARLLPDEAPRTVAVMRALLPYHERVIHVRWSGEAVWVPLGAHDFGLPYENATAHPAPGTMILYPGGVSETELLLAYGAVSFASKAGPLAGNPFLRIVDDLDRLAALGRETLQRGALSIRIEAA